MSEKISCKHCPAKVDSRRFEEHRILCEGSKPFLCDLCGKRFASMRSVQGHASRYHTANERGTEFKCIYCEHGSNSKADMDKHEKRHEEAGGPGFRSRSRSRSREPARNYNAPIVSVSNGISESQLRNEYVNESRSRPAVALKQSTFQVRARSNPTVFNSDPQPQFVKRPPSSQGGTTRPNWALMQPNLNNIAKVNLNNNHSQKDAESTSAQNGTTTFNREIVRKIMAEENRVFDNAMKLCREQNRALRKVCENAGLPLSEDKIEDEIREYERLFGALSEGDYDENLD